ncbi:MAG: PEP-CTERM sorting domain-containing protein [Phormidesmis sp. RL_2_1]|nr:PEP-CTERM sorting domain-containing protein [Phormidesmis sp. RL_2_1]
MPCPLAALAALSMAAPASAAVFFNNNDALNITGSYKAPAATGFYEFLKLDGSSAAVGSYGNFGVQNDSTGGFAAFGTNGAVTATYDILSLDFTNPATYVGKTFLSLSNGVDAFTFKITEAAINQGSFAVGNMGGSLFSLKGIFASLDDENLGEGVLSGQFTGNRGGYSATLTVVESASVPEPSALLGLGLAAGTMIVIRRRQTVSA